MVSDEKLIIVRYKPGQRLRRRLAFLASCVLIAVAGFWSGQSKIAREYAVVAAERDELLMDLARLQESEAQLRQQNANLERGRAIDEHAQRGVRQTIQSLEDELHQLREDVGFYKSIMAPSGDAKGLQVQKLEVLPVAAGERKFSYKLVLTQLANNDKYVEGVVAVNVIGKNDGAEEILPLRDISDVEELGIKFRFRYFQDIVGELTLPDGFEPDKVQVVAQSKKVRGQKSTRVEQTFNWGTKEQGNVGEKG